MNKNRTYNRVKGITIIEMMIALVIISFMILLMIQTRVFFSKQSNFIDQINKKGSSFYQFTFLLEQDFMKGETFWLDQNKTLSSFYKNMEVTYLFTENLIIRKQENYVDTFNIQTSDYKVSGYTKEREAKIMVRDIFFHIIYKEQKIPIIIHKEIAAKHILQYPLDKSIQYNSWE